MRSDQRVVRLGAFVRGRGGIDARALEYAVLDVETTGLEPAEGARVCEVAVVRMRGDGTVLAEFNTLVNPRTALTGQEFHGISGGDVTGAPTSEAVIGDLAAILSGAVVVSHKLDFEERFLAAEFAAGGVLSDLPGLCTLRTLRAQLHLPRYSLARASYSLTGHWPTGQHTALGDARACARLLAELLHNAPGELRYAGPPPRRLATVPGAARLKPRRHTKAQTAPPTQAGARTAEIFEDFYTPGVRRRWHAQWRPLELDPLLCGGRFTSDERDAAVLAAESRFRRRSMLSTAAALTVGVAGAAALRSALKGSRPAWSRPAWSRPA